MATKTHPVYVDFYDADGNWTGDFAILDNATSLEQAVRLAHDAGFTVLEVECALDEDDAPIYVSAVR